MLVSYLLSKDAQHGFDETNAYAIPKATFAVI